MAGKGDAAIRHIDRRGVQRGNAALMTKHTKGGPEQIGGNVAWTSHGNWLDQNFSTSTYQIARGVWNAKEQLRFIALSLGKFSGHGRKRIGDTRTANDDVYLRGTFAAAGYEPRQRQVRPD